MCIANAVIQSPKKKRGGIRAGAGRKRTRQTIYLVLSKGEWEEAKAIGGGNLVDGIKRAIKLCKLE
jgi:hypothetical protein